MVRDLRQTCMKSSSDDKGVCVAWEEPETPTTFPEDGFAEIRFSPPANDSVFSAMLCAKSSISVAKVGPLLRCLQAQKNEKNLIH